jgi:hypothetical protein
MATTLRNGKLFCTNCGGSFDLNLPLAVTDMTKRMKAFEALHCDCPQTWKEPTIAPSRDLNEKIIFWLMNGETGISSKTMVEVMTDRPCLSGFRRDHPCDPDDFNRCYKLLEMIPELKPMLPKMRSASKAWSNLIDNWDKLTEMLEEQLRTHKDNGMYDLMQECIK